MAAFSDTTNKNGLIQIFEFWTRNPDGTVTGTLLKQATARINAAFERVLPTLIANSDHIKWDDTNHTDAPIGYVNIVSGQPDYKITTDDNSLDILNITAVRILPSSSATAYIQLERLTVDDTRVLEAMSPAETGTPTHFVENGSFLYLSPKPNYAATNGIEIFFAREQSYFVSTDTTKEPGIPKPFHELLALYAALDWNRVNRTDDRALILELKEEIAKQEQKLNDFVELQTPRRNRIKTSSESNA